MSGGNIFDLKRSFLGNQRISQWSSAVFFFSLFCTEYWKIKELKLLSPERAHLTQLSVDQRAKHRKDSVFIHHVATTLPYYSGLYPLFLWLIIKHTCHFWRNVHILPFFQLKNSSLKYYHFRSPKNCVPTFIFSWYFLLAHLALAHPLAFYCKLNLDLSVMKPKTIVELHTSQDFNWWTLRTLISWWVRNYVARNWLLNKTVRSFLQLVDQAVCASSCGVYFMLLMKQWSPKKKTQSIDLIMTSDRAFRNTCMEKSNKRLHLSDKTFQ